MNVNMKAELFITDLLDGKVCEETIPCIVRIDGKSTIMNLIQRKPNRQIIAKFLHHFGEASLELKQDGEIIAKGKFTCNAFSGRWNCEAVNA